MKKWLGLMILCLSMVLVACGSDAGEESAPDSGAFVSSGSGEAIRIVAGSEMKELEPVLEAYAKDSGQKIEMDYAGSLEISQMLESNEVSYDAVWPASSIWLDLGDTHRLLKHAETTSITPVIFGIRQSLAEELGFVGRDDVSLDEIMAAIESGKLSFCMTSATQSNSGASAYLGFLTALSGNPEGGLTSENLADAALREKIVRLLSGVDRSSGSSNWLVDLFLKGDYDAMVNYETLIIQANKKLEAEGKEPLYAVYPKDGISISDSPLAYVDAGDDKKEEDFLKLQAYLLSEEGQSAIEKTGKRSAYGNVSEANRGVFRTEWGIRADKLLSPIRLPKAEVIRQALDLYQTSFKKPAFTVYVLDYSGSMYGERMDAMVSALEQVLLPDNARAHMLMGTERDHTVLLPFHSEVHAPAEADGADTSELYAVAKRTEIGGGTAMYEAVDAALDLLAAREDLSNYVVSVVVLTDGQANGSMQPKEFAKRYQARGMDVPIFSIQFGGADPGELEYLADLSNARVFDGRDDLIRAFKTAKGYN